jgi:uncharacterized membrane protein YcaP (DUF421 family)
MELLKDIFGEGKDLNALQMSCRGILVFIISISLGAILSRAIVGASSFLPIIVCCFVIVTLHRAFSWLVVNNKTFGRFIEGDKILLYKDGRFISENMKKGLLCEEDAMQGIRKSALTEDMNIIDKAYMERNGEISPIKKST